MPERTYKSLDEAVAEMLQWFWYATGREPAMVEGDILRTVFEAVGFEVEDITTRFDRALEAAIPEAVFAAFGFPRLEAQKAQVTLRFSRFTPAPYEVLIPVGTRAQTASGLVFWTIQEGTIASGALNVDVAAEAFDAGRVYNVPAGAITQLVDGIPGVDAVTNPVPATGGQDEETPEEQGVRFARWIAQIARGTKAALAAAALSTALPGGREVAAAKVRDTVDDSAIPVGYVRVVVDIDPPPPSPPDDLALVGASLEAMRAAGVLVTPILATRVPVNVAFTLRGTPQDLNGALEAVRSLFAGLGIGEGLTLDRLKGVIYRAAPEAQALTLTAPASDLTVGAEERLVLGTLSGGLV